MARRFGWLSACALAVACAGDLVTAPGSCPAYCPGVTIGSTDTVLTGVVSDDNSFRGYQVPGSAVEVQLVGPGGTRPTRVIARFSPFGTRLPPIVGDTTTRPVLAVDSFRVELTVRRRSSDSVRIAAYRLPSDLDPAATFDDVTPWFQDSTKLVEFLGLPDTLGLVQGRFAAGLIPNLSVADSFEAVLGFAAVSPADAFIGIATMEAGAGPLLSRFVQVDSVPGEAVARVDARLTTTDTYVFPALADPPPGVLAVGGAPAARAFLRFTLPPGIVDSSNVVRATLLLIPAGPSLVTAGDSLRVLAHAMLTDLGPKSPAAASDTSLYAGARVPAGTDTIRVDVTGVLRSWGSDSVPTQVLMLRSTPEAGTISEIRFWSSANPGLAPRLHITYIPPLRYGGGS